jgi:hypothetical protein
VPGKFQVLRASVGGAKYEVQIGVVFMRVKSMVDYWDGCDTKMAGKKSWGSVWGWSLRGVGEAEGWNLLGS